MMLARFSDETTNFTDSLHFTYRHMSFGVFLVLQTTTCTCKFVCVLCLYIYIYLYSVHIQRLQLRFCEHIEGYSVTVKAINFFHGVVFLLFILTISSSVLCGFWRSV